MSHKTISIRLAKAFTVPITLLLLLLAILLIFVPDQKADQLPTLSVKQTIERELKGDESHFYSITLSAGQYLHLVVDQRGIDVVVTLFAPDGRKLAEIDSPNGTQGPEPVFAVIETSGMHRLEVRSPEKVTAAGRYEVKIEELRSATEQDKNRVIAERIFNQAELLRGQRTEASLKNAIQKYEEALPFYRLIGEQNHEAVIFTTIGLICDLLGQKKKALDFYKQALPLYQAAGNQVGEATVFNNIGLVYDSLGEKQQALDYYSKSLPLFQAAGNQVGEATTLNNIGLIYGSFSESQKALDYYRQALSIYRAIQDRKGEATTLTNFGAVYEALRDKQNALTYYRQALEIYRAVKDLRSEAISLNNLGSVYYALDEIQKAFDCYQQALQIYRQIADPTGLAATFTNFGVLYISLGEIVKAVDYYRQALALHRAINNRKGEAAMLNNMGLLYTEAGRRAQALESYNQALLLFRMLGDPKGEATALNNTGSVYSKYREYQKAFDYYEQALQIYRKIEDLDGEAATLNNMGVIYNALNEKQKALECSSQALLFRRTTGDRSGEALILSNLKDFSPYNSRLGIFYGKHSVNVIQFLRSNVQNMDRSLQKAYLRSIRLFYRGLIETLIFKGRYGEALQIFNALKDQQFFDFDQTSQAKLKPLTPTPREAEFIQRYEKSSDALGSLGKQLTEFKRKLDSRQPNAEESNQLRFLTTQLKTASDEFWDVLKQADTEFSKPADDKDKIDEIADVAQMQATLRELSQQTGQKAVAIYTLVTNENFHALLVTMNGITAVSTPIKSKELNTKARQLWALLQSDQYNPTILSSELYNIIFKPIEARLPKNTKTIMWSLDENLRYLPMAALFDGKQYLVERYNNVVFTRADKERMTRAVSPQWTGVGFGTSRPADVKYLETLYRFNALPNVTAELNAVFKTRESRNGVFSGDIFPDASFTREAMLAALKQHPPLVHIASHFKFAPSNEAKSFLLLGDETVFPLNEMKQYVNLFQGVELLTLSACETAVQRVDSTDREIDTFAELAQRLGAGAVMATLWKVRDDSSYLLMRGFYQRKQDVRRETKAESLRQAQLALLNGSAKLTVFPQTENVQAKRSSGESAAITILAEGSPMPAKPEPYMVYIEAKYAPEYRHNSARPYAHPYYWSPFVLFGNWR